MELKNYFFDTYALCEIFEGNPNYYGFASGVGIVITKINLMEFYYSLLREYDRQMADKCFELFNSYCIDVDDETIRQAMVFKLLHKNKRLSYIDCVGYILARKRGVKFLTGDKEFETMENVEFVK